jgi:hypothetical protein
MSIIEIDWCVYSRRKGAACCALTIHAHFINGISTMLMVQCIGHLEPIVRCL